MNSLISVNELDDMVNIIPKTVMRCADVQENIMNYLSHPEQDITPGNKWNIFWIDDPNTQSVDQMKEFITKYMYLAVDIDCQDLEHAFVICSTDQGYRIVDGYIYHRSCCQRSFNFNDLSDFIMSPSLEKWNTIFDCDEKKILSDQREIYLNYSYYDRSQPRKMYLNGIEI